MRERLFPLVYLPDIRDDYDRFRAFEKPGSPRYQLIDPKDLPEAWALLIDEAEAEEGRKILLEAWVVILDKEKLAREFEKRLEALKLQLEETAAKLEKAGWKERSEKVIEAARLIDEGGIPYRSSEMRIIKEIFRRQRQENMEKLMGGENEL